MRRLTILSLAVVVMLASCKKDDDDPGFTSAEGSWVYTTPEGKVTVFFDLVKDGSSWSVKDESTIVVDGFDGKAVVTPTNITPPTIDEISINANDTKLVYAYMVVFTAMRVSDDFKTITATDVTYYWPHDKLNSVSNVTISRK